MAGILNSKERVMDFIITQEGKQQAGYGELRVKFASFTDYHTFYEKSGSLNIPNLAEDASNRIFFEAYSHYQDVIVPELQAGMSLRPFRTSDFDILGKTVVSGTFQVGFINTPNVLKDTSGIDSENSLSLTNAIPEVLNGITKNFTDQQIIGSIDEYSMNNEFSPSANNDKFVISSKTSYFRSSEQGDKTGTVKLENLPSIFNDRHFSHFPNFKYLPPENVPFPGEKSGSVLASYPILDEKSILSFDDLMNELKTKQKFDVSFDVTSRSNNLVCQLFESNATGIEKLSVVDFGSFPDEEPSSPKSLISPGKRVFFVGKMMLDKTGAETFLCMFTIVID